jgi:hypothetical protein
MNEYWFQAITNIALIVAIVFLVLNDHVFFGILLVFGLRVASSKDDKKEE